MEDLRMEEVSVNNNPIVVQDLEMVENAYNTAVLEDVNNAVVCVVGGLCVAAG